jgi:hypothetical protein
MEQNEQIFVAAALLQPVVRAGGAARLSFMRPIYIAEEQGLTEWFASATDGLTLPLVFIPLTLNCSQTARINLAL